MGYQMQFLLPVMMQWSPGKSVVVIHSSVSFLCSTTGGVSWAAHTSLGRSHNALKSNLHSDCLAAVIVIKNHPLGEIRSAVTLP